MEIRQRKNKGFTLIEMMVAVSIFVIVAFIVVSTLLTLSYSYKKAQKLRLLMDNLSFSVQSMSLNIREGVSYELPCASGDYSSCISFRSIDSRLYNEPKRVCFSLYDRDFYGTGSGKGIKKCEDVCPCNSDGSDIISPDINITNFSLNKTGAKLKKVQIMIGGEAGKNREKTNFFIQNTVSQRNTDS